DKRHRACKNGSAQRLVDARVHDFLDGPPPSAGETFPDPVVNDNRIINGIASDGEHSANHCESKFAPKKREHADGHEHVMQQGDNRPHGKSKLEAKRHENQNTQNAQAERDQRIFCQFTTYECTDAFRAFYPKARARQRLHDLPFHLVAGVQWGADGDVTPADLRGFLDGSISKTDWLERTAHLPDINLARRTQSDEVAAAKINAEVTFAAFVKGCGAS